MDRRMIYAGPEPQRCVANHAALSPVSILKRVERVHPELPAQMHGTIRRNWGEVAECCKRLASAFAQQGMAKGNTVALIAPNIPEALECALATPMIGAVLNANNIRLDAGTLAYILGHGEAKVLLVDTEFSAMAAAAATQSGRTSSSSISKTRKASVAIGSARRPMRIFRPKAIQVSPIPCRTTNGTRWR